MIKIVEYTCASLCEITEIWNEVVRTGVAFPQMEQLSVSDGTAEKFFAEQSFCAAAIDTEIGTAVGLYILHPNNVGRCGHISNASFAVKSEMRGMGIGRKLVEHCLKKGKELGFKILQFNAVVKTNRAARSLYESLGFKQIGIVPNGFLLKSGEYEDIVLYYYEL